MDDDPVLRELAAELERDDPLLAALLRAGPAGARQVLAAPPPWRTPVPPVAPPAPRPAGSAPPPAPPVPPLPAARSRRAPAWLVAAGTVLVGVGVVLASIPLGLAVFGVLGITLLLFSPVLALWWCATADELRPPDDR